MDFTWSSFTLREGSTITPWRALAKAFSHRPTRLSYDDHGAITHNGMADGYLYEIDEPLVIGRDICQHPRTTMDANAEFLTCRPLRVKLVERLSSGYDPLLGERMRVMLTACGLELLPDCLHALCLHIRRELPVNREDEIVN